MSDNLHNEIEELFEEAQNKDITYKEALENNLRIINPNKPRKEKPFDGLPLRKRAILILSLADFTQQEIAILLKISVPTVNRELNSL